MASRLDLSTLSANVYLDENQPPQNLAVCSRQHLLPHEILLPRCSDPAHHLERLIHHRRGAVGDSNWHFIIADFQPDN
jgi:hypothetical protein